MKRNVAALLAVITATLFLPSLASGATRNVSGAAGCSDTSGSPYCTINAAILAAAPGDTIQISAGTYAGAIASFSKPLTFAGAGSTTSGTVITKSVTYTGIGPLSVSNLRISGGGTNFKVSGTGNFSGLTLSGASFVGNGGGAHGVFIKQNGTVSNVTVTNCTFTNHGQSGLLIEPGTGSTTNVDHVTVTGTTFDSNGEYGLRIDPRVTSLQVSNSNITNNAIDGLLLLNANGARLQNLIITGNRNGILLIPLTSAQSISNLTLTNINASNNTKFISGHFGSGITFTGDTGSISQIAIAVTAPASTGSVTNSVTIAGNETPDPNTANKTATVTTAVQNAVTLTSISLTPSSASLVPGQTVQLTATAIYSDNSTQNVNAQAVWTASANTVASVSASGLVTASAPGSATITASFNTQSATSGIAVSPAEPLPPDPSTVASPIDPTVVTTLFESTKFLYSGANPIQAGVVAGTIEKQRACVLRGTVRDRTGTVLPGVAITILGHPEFGTTRSRLDGMFDLAVNGGGPLTVIYRKNGYIEGQRQVATAWNDFRLVPDIALIPFDDASTPITSGNAQYQIARGSSVNDDRGSRRATILFPPNTTASMLLPDGSTSSLPSMTVRAASTASARTARWQCRPSFRRRRAIPIAWS